MGRRWGLDGVASDTYKCQGGDDRLTPYTGAGGSEGVGFCYGGTPPLTNPAYKTANASTLTGHWPRKWSSSHIPLSSASSKVIFGTLVIPELSLCYEIIL